MKLSIPLSLALTAVDQDSEWDTISDADAIARTKVLRRNHSIIIKRTDCKAAIIISNPNKNGLRDVKWQRSSGSPKHPTIITQSSLSTIGWRVWLGKRKI